MSLRRLAVTVLLASAAACDTADVPPRISNAEEISERLSQAYPADLRAAGVGGRVMVEGLVRPDGSFEVDAVESEGATDPRFAAAARAVLPHARFESGGARVRVRFPIRFDPPAEPDSASIPT